MKGVLPIAAAAVWAALCARAAAAPSPAPEAGPCSLESAAPTQVAAVLEDFDLLLDDGRRATLVGLDFPGLGAAPAAARERLTALLLGADAFVAAPAAASVDRWGRAPVQLFIFSQQGGETRALSLAGVLLAEGLARFRPDPAAEACADFFRAAEEEARAARRGVWALADYFVVDARAFSVNPVPEALFNKKGMMLVEGFVFSVNEARGTLYLNFGPRRGRDFSVVIAIRDLANSERFGKFVRSLTGRRVRVRGLLETSFGPRIAISSPVEIESVDHAAAH